MHPESDALLDAIFDASDDDTPRLVYADWLQEYGQSAYAEFIRLQCAAAREPLWSAEANRLWEEIGRVWARLDEEWWPATRDVWDFEGIIERLDFTHNPFGQRVSSPGWRYGQLDAIHFHRGLLRESCVMDYKQLLRYGSTCWPWLPLPATVLQDYDIVAERELLAHPRLARIRHLRPVAGDHGHDLWPLIESPRLANLEVLDLSALTLSVGDVEAMLTPGLYLRLREVRMRVPAAARNSSTVAGCLSADVDASAQYLQRLRRQLEARFEKVVWFTER